MRKEAERFWKQAEADLKTAGDNLTARNYYATAFFCHQATEKALKALFIHVRNDLPPRTHNLIELGTALGIPEPHLEFLRRLTPEYIISRYPDVAGAVPAELYSEATANELLGHTTEVIGWISETIRS